jgi:hypothetical protein
MTPDEPQWHDAAPDITTVIEKLAESADGQVYVVRAVKRGMPIRGLPARTGLFDLVMEAALQWGAGHLNGWVVGILRPRGWRAPKLVHKERVSAELAARRVNDLADRIAKLGPGAATPK